ncbi:MAG: type III-A CRISPR-associated protein Cas10/Csm1 [Bacteroidales bacterium 36-12]|nr:MAG: type III-A CRISPR-associated protein Cas10/Csm1 [Bacteroidales bacterium 36-12]
MDDKRNLIYLAGLLHDIGKFYQRADQPFSDAYAELSDYSKKLANDICPINDQGRFGYQHVVWTNEFFEKNRSKFESIPGIKANLYNTTNEDCLENLACNHHKPQSVMQAIITMADWWSAGIDRRNASEQAEAKDEDTKINWGKTRYKEIPLYSVFNTIHSGKGQHGFPLVPMDISGKSFPKAIHNKEDGILQEDYKILWDKFIEEFNELPVDSINGFTESLTYLLKKYTWCIPSNTMDMANVSLFDHLKTTAAFADCIAMYYDEHSDNFNWDNTNKRLSLKNDKYPVVLLGCDISGIQKFIYNISSRKAATSLKGRSFYLQLMIDAIIQRIIMHKDIQATNGHVVYSSGGKFYMILPNTEKVIHAIKEITFDIENEVWNEHKGKLIVNIDYIPFAYRNESKEIDFEGVETGNKDLGKLWKSLADKLTEKKNKKFKDTILSDYASFFEPNEKGGDVKVCAVTGEELSKGNSVKLKDTETVVSKSVYDQIELGKKLKDADYLITYKDKSELSTYLSSKLEHITIFGVANYLFDDLQLIYDDADFRKISSADVSRVKRINNVAFTAAPLKGQKVSYGFQFYGGNKQAINKSKERNKTFEELTEVSVGDKNSETYFGILRMDVDGLGEIFINGIPDELKTFSAYATLSSALDWFFSGYLNTMREKYKDNINILYSGGDDLFAIGRWDLLISFAEDIRKEFRRYVGREDISISAGIAMVGNKYPIAKAAELAGNAEHAAKQFSKSESSKGNNISKRLPEDKQETKNAINFLGETVSWNEEYNWVKSKKNEFVRLINIPKHAMSKGILHRMMLFAAIQAENKRKKDQPDFKPDLSYYWNSAYYLKRYMENKDAEVIEFCKTLQVEVLDSRKLELIALAARWAELEIKESINN